MLGWKSMEVFIYDLILVFFGYYFTMNKVSLILELSLYLHREVFLIKLCKYVD